MNTSNFDLRTSSSGSGISRIGVLAGVGLIRAYQLVLAPFTGGACRFHPTCSEYAREAVEEHGLVRGIGLAIRRVWRCHPFAQPGIDPVPPRTGFQATRPQPETWSRRP